MVERESVSERIRRDIVVIGASAGGVQTLTRVAAALPPGLAAAVCIVLHISPESPSALAGILGRAGPLPCRPASDGAPLTSGQILVAPPDRHLVVEDGYVRLTIGPRVNNHRPAVDPLFRSAAQAGGERVIGVVLSGTRDDGTAGLAMIKALGGAAIVQDPAEALYPGMPSNALALVAVDAVVRSEEVAAAIAAMVNGEDWPPAPAAQAPTPETEASGLGTLIRARSERGTTPHRIAERAPPGKQPARPVRRPVKVGEDDRPEREDGAA
jgi:two-component system, chemotaxis family, protein-glutamate methylesterase/glutaminase